MRAFINTTGDCEANSLNECARVRSFVRAYMRGRCACVRGYASRCLCELSDREIS